MAATLEGTDVGKRFGGLSVLSRVSFRVGEGEIVPLIGPNGAGKTTLFNLINGLLRPSAGAIRLGGRDITALPAHRISRLGVGRTFQTPRPFLDLTAEDNVAAAALFAPRAAGSASELLALVELKDCARVPARHLPVARRKLLELAMALALGPRLLLLDEVLAGLTPTEVERAIAMLRRIRDARGIGIFWVEHVMRAVMQTAERVVVLHHGEIICDGAPATVARDGRVLEAYLGEAASPDTPTTAAGARRPPMSSRTTTLTTTPKTGRLAMPRRRFIATAGAGALALAARRRPADAQPKPVRIGYTLSATGPYAVGAAITQAPNYTL